MKLNTIKKLTMILILSSVAMIAESCSKSGAKEKVDNTALLYLVNSPSAPDADQQICLQAYFMANSCVAGTTQQFNAGVGCAHATLSALPTTNGTVNQQVTALRSCVEKAVRDATQPCNLPQFNYTQASQAASGVFKTTCSVAEYAIAPATAKTKQDLTSLLKY